jgi:hypothetical protein
MLIEGALGATCAMSVKTALPNARLGFVQVTLPLAPAAGVVQVQPAGAESETNVVPAGSVSLIVTDCASLGPAFATVIVYVTLAPAATGSGESVIVMLTSAEPAPTLVVVVAELFAVVGSVVAEVMVAVLMSVVPDPRLGSAFATSVKMSAAGPKLAFVHVTTPLAPTAGVVHVHDPAVASDTNVVLAGSVFVKVALAALLGPLFVTVTW